MWNTDTARLLIMDCKDFNKLGIGLDDLIDGFVQTVLAVIAIDKMSQRLVDKQGNFDVKTFETLNDDKFLVKEILNKAKNGSPLDWIKASTEKEKQQQKQTQKEQPKVKKL